MNSHDRKTGPWASASLYGNAIPTPSADNDYIPSEQHAIISKSGVGMSLSGYREC